MITTKIIIDDNPLRIDLLQPLYTWPTVIRQDCTHSDLSQASKHLPRVLCMHPGAAANLLASGMKPYTIVQLRHQVRQ